MKKDLNHLPHKKQEEIWQWKPVGQASVYLMRTYNFPNKQMNRTVKNANRYFTLLQIDKIMSFNLRLDKYWIPYTLKRQSRVFTTHCVLTQNQLHVCIGLVSGGMNILKNLH